MQLLLLFLDDDECTSDPCQNGGACVDGVDSYTCACAAGYSGDHCEESESTTLPSI